MQITLSQNEYISGISGVSGVINCIILGQRVDIGGISQRSSGNVLSLVANSHVGNAYQQPDYNQDFKKNVILYQGVLDSSITQLLTASDTEYINISSIRIINTSPSVVNGIKFYLNGTDIENLISENSLGIKDSKTLDACCPSVTVQNNITTTGGTGGGGFANITLGLSDIPFTAQPGKCYILEDGVMPSDLPFDMSALSTEGDEILILNREKTFVLSYSGQSVYYSDDTIVPSMPNQWNVWLRFANNKLRIITG